MAWAAGSQHTRPYDHQAITADASRTAFASAKSADILKYLSV